MAYSRDFRRPSGAKRHRAGRIQLRLESPPPRLRRDRSRPTGACRNRPTASAPVAAIVARASWEHQVGRRGRPMFGHRRLSDPVLRSSAEGSPCPPFLRSPETRLLYPSVSHVAITMRCWNSGVSTSSRWASNTRRSGPPFIDTNQAPSLNSGPPPGTGATLPQYRRPLWMNSIDRDTLTSLATLSQLPPTETTLDPEPRHGRRGVGRHVDSGEHGYSLPAA